MARSGGTLISRCLGCMSGVLLLSEIHPLGTAQFNPLVQAQRWYGLLSSQDLADAQGAPADRLRRRDRADSPARRRCRPAAGDPGLEPSGLHGRAVRGQPGVPAADRRRARGTLRAPPDLHGPAPARSMAELARARRGAGQADARRATSPATAGSPSRRAQIGFLRYEEFVADPDAVMRTLCRQPRPALRSPLRRAVVELRVRHRRRLGEPRRLRDPAGAPAAGGTRAARRPASQFRLHRQPRAARLRAPVPGRPRGAGRERNRRLRRPSARPRRSRPRRSGYGVRCGDSTQLLVVWIRQLIPRRRAPRPQADVRSSRPWSRRATRAARDPWCDQRVRSMAPNHYVRRSKATEITWPPGSSSPVSPRAP